MKREPQFYKEESAVKYGFINFESALKSTLMKDRVIDEAMKRYAEDMCKEQRKICYENASLSATETWYVGGKPKEISKDVGKEYLSTSLNKESILNCPLATDN